MRGKICTRQLVLAAALGGCLAGAGWVSAAALTWSGDGDSDNSGSWNTAADWSSAAVPGSGDTVTLGNVSTGTRTVTVDTTPASATKGITFTQTTAGAVNTLVISSGATLSLSNGGTALGNGSNAAAGMGSVLTDIDGTLAFTTTGPTAQTLTNTINFGNGGIIQYTALNNPTINIAGAMTTSDVVSGGTATIATLGNSGTPTMSVNVSAGGTLNVSSGTLNISATTSGAQTSIAYSSAAGSTATLSSGATLALVTATGNGNKSASFSNAGSFTQGGQLTLCASGSKAAATINNTGTWTISDANAQVVQTSGSVAPLLQVTNGVGGTLGGSGTLSFSNQNTSATPITLTNQGVIDPGANGTGSLTLSNVALASSQGTLRIDANGAAAGQYATLALASGSTSGTGVLNLSGSGDVLDLHLLNGFTPTSNFTLSGFVTYSSCSGAFDSFLLNGAPLPAGWSMSVNYNATSADLLVNVPEPGTMGLGAVSLLSLATVRRRRHQEPGIPQA